MRYLVSIVINGDGADLPGTGDDRIQHLFGIFEFRRMRQKLELRLRQKLGQGVQLTT
jgi:hypothetical protein